MTDVPLKPCPFCGGKAYMKFYGSLADHFTIFCDKCQVETNICNSKDLSTKLWNERVEVSRNKNLTIDEIREVGVDLFTLWENLKVEAPFRAYLFSLLDRLEAKQCKGE